MFKKVAPNTFAIRNYYDFAHKQKPFVPGKSPINYAGRSMTKKKFRPRSKPRLTSG